MANDPNTADADQEEPEAGGEQESGAGYGNNAGQQSVEPPGRDGPAGTDQP